MGYEIARLIAAEHDDREVGIGLHAPNEGAELVERVGIEQIDWAVIEGHPPVGRRDLADMELFRSHHESTLRSFEPASSRGGMSRQVVIRSGHELLPPVYVVGGAGKRGVAHDVDG